LACLFCARAPLIHSFFCLCCILPSGWGLSIQQHTVALVGCHGHVPT
jgi:hypothetical protein